jgi:hypothetical protein
MNVFFVVVSFEGLFGIFFCILCGDVEGWWTGCFLKKKKHKFRGKEKEKPNQNFLGRKTGALHPKKMLVIV